MAEGVDLHPGRRAERLRLAVLGCAPDLVLKGLDLIIKRAKWMENICRDFVFAFLLASLGLTGCSSSQQRTTIHGTVQTGVGSTALPISDATVTLYNAGGGTPTAVLQTTTATDGTFLFNLNGPVAGLYYVTASSNSSVKLMATLGTSPETEVIVNELTTLAGAYAFAAFFQNGLIVGPHLPLRVASDMARNISKISTGTVSDLLQASPNGYETNTLQLVGSLGNLIAACVRNPNTECTGLFTLTPSMNGTTPTDTLQALVNLARRPSQNLQDLFTRSLAQQVFTPSLTVDFGPNATDYLKKLDAFTIAVKFNNSPSCPFAGPGNVAFDADGHIWITNNVIQGTPRSTTCQIVLKLNGQPADGSNGGPVSPITGGGILGQGFGIAITQLGHVWSGNFGWGGVFPSDGSVTKTRTNGTVLSPSTGIIAGTYRAQGIAIDFNNNVWIASYGNNKVVLFPDGNDEIPVSYADANTTPFDVAIDQNGHAWVTYSSSGTVSKLQYSGGSIQKLFTVSLPASSEPKGLAIDSAGNAWVAAGGTSAVYIISTSGTLTTTLTGSGINAPWAVSIDSSDNVWVANFGDAINAGVRYSIVQICGTRVQNCPQGSTGTSVLSPSSGFTLPTGGSQVLLADGNPLYFPINIPAHKPLFRLTSVTVDMAGNAWAANNWKPIGSIDLTSNPGGDGMVVFVGIGNPNKAPALGPARPLDS